MKICAIACVEPEQEKLLRAEIEKQTVQPYEIVILTDTQPAVGINERRKRIAENQHLLEEIAQRVEADFIWQLEGDSVLEPDTLEKLIQSYKKLKGDDFGYVSGIEVGRHGIYCIGAWHVAEDRQSFESVDYRSTGLVQVDATGLYCLLAPKKVWLNGLAIWRDECWGPDVNWGLSIRRNKYVDMSIKIGHRTSNGIIKVDGTSTSNVFFYKENNVWKFKQEL